MSYNSLNSNFTAIWYFDIIFQKILDVYSGRFGFELGYNIKDNEVKVLGKNRSLADIIRSIAHELVHHKQNQNGELSGNAEEGADGSPIENEANAKAGEIVRKFGKIKPEIYDL